LRFDITKFNQAYFDRLRDHVSAAGDRGIYVSVMLFNGWGIDGKGISGYNPWAFHPYNASNNINGINGDPSSTGNGLSINTLSITAVVNAQKDCIRKVVDTLNDLDNVLYEISNEADASSTSWQKEMINYLKSYQSSWQTEMINYLKSYQSGKAKQHPVGMTCRYTGSTTTLTNSPADWYSPCNSPADYKSNPPVAAGGKVSIVDTDHIYGMGGDALFMWKQFLRGHNTMYMDTLEGLSITPTLVSPPSTEASARIGIGQTERYALRLNLANVKPAGSLSTTGYCMAWPGNQYIVLSTGGAFSVDLSGAAGKTFNVEWLNVDADTTASGGRIQGGSVSQSFTAPFTGAAVLLLY
jgi:hypothetical protein